MLLFYCLLVQSANPFHSNPDFAESDPLAVGGDLEVCKISVVHLAREVRFCAGFATLRPFRITACKINFCDLDKIKSQF